MLQKMKIKMIWDIDNAQTGDIMKNKQYELILKVQLLIGILLMLCLSFMHKFIFLKQESPIILCALIVIFVLILLQNKGYYFQVMAKGLSILVLPYVFNFLVYNGVSFFNLAFPSRAMFFSIVGCILLLVVNIPWVMVAMPVLKNGFLRVLSIAIIDVSWTFNINNFANLPESLHFLVYDALIVALESFVLAFFITKAWGLKFSWNLKFVKTSNFQLGSWLLLLGLMVWFIFFNTYLNIVNTWPELLSFWHWNNYEISYHFTADILAFSATAGIGEETIRGLEIIALLYAMRNYKGRVMLAVIISAILFSLIHLSGLNTITNGTYYSIDMVAQQLTYALGFGLVFGVFYLYTGKLWLGMLIHFLIDLETTSSDESITMFTGWLAAIIILVVSVLIFGWMLTGKRRKFMEDNVDRIIAVK